MKEMYSENMKSRKCIVTQDIERTAPSWLAVRMGPQVSIIYKIIDGAVKVKGVSINHEVAEIGDAICFDGKRLSVERR